MGAEKSNYIVDSEVSKTNSYPRTTNVIDLLKKNKVEEKKEKKVKFYTFLVFLVLSIVVGTVIYL